MKCRIWKDIHFWFMQADYERIPGVIGYPEYHLRSFCSWKEAAQAAVRMLANYQASAWREQQ